MKFSCKFVVKDSEIVPIFRFHKTNEDTTGETCDIDLLYKLFPGVTYRDTVKHVFSYESNCNSGLHVVASYRGVDMNFYFQELASVTPDAALYSLIYHRLTKLAKFVDYVDSAVKATAEKECRIEFPGLK
jgi:hypothetical protein